jgi:hypothetical protein
MPTTRRKVNDKLREALDARDAAVEDRRWLASGSPEYEEASAEVDRRDDVVTDSVGPRNRTRPATKPG